MPFAFGINVRGRPASLGGLNTQSIQAPTPTVAPPTSATSTSITSNRTTNNRASLSSTTGAGAVARAPLAASSLAASPLASSALATSALSRTVATTTALQRLPVDLRINSVVPAVRMIPPLISPRLAEFPEDILSVSETRIENENFVPVERDGISSFRPEIISILDFLPLWQDHPGTAVFSPAGKLIDVQYNSLLLRKETLVHLLDGIMAANLNSDELDEILTNLGSSFQSHVQTTSRTIDFLGGFLNQIDLAKSVFNIKGIPRSSFNSPPYLPLDDFFERKLQIRKNNFEIYSDTKILYQLLADFKEIMENYSFGLLDLADPDRLNDRDPVRIDKTFTTTDGFTFNLEQIRSKNQSINAIATDFFNGFLNSLPPDSDDRIKLLMTLLSKEYRVSKGLGVNDNSRVLRDFYNTGDTGSPFDNIVGVVGDTIFDSPLGANSLSSLFSVQLNQNAVVLPFESKFVDTDDVKKTFIPGTNFFVDNVLKVQGSAFNIQPFIDYSDNFSSIFIKAKRLIENLFELNADTNISPTFMFDAALSSFKNSIQNTVSVNNINRDQAVIAALFKLANNDNQLKSLLFQYSILLGMASNSSDDVKPIFTRLVSELGSLQRLPNIRVSAGVTPNLRGGVASLRPFLEQLAAEIENRVFTLTTPTPKEALGSSLLASPDFTRVSAQAGSVATTTTAAADRSSISVLKQDQTTINLPRFTIKRILLSNIDSRSSTSTNLFKEFIDLANRYTLAAAVNGEQVFLLDDGSGRTRYNFINTSTQLLMLFEIIASMAGKYSFSTFEKSRISFNAFVTVDSELNEFITRAIQNIISIRTTSVSRAAIPPASGPAAVVVPAQTGRSTSGNNLSERFAGRRRIGRSSADSNTSSPSSRTRSSGGIFSAIPPEDLTAVNRSALSPFIGRSSIGQLGRTQTNELLFDLRANNLQIALNSIRNKLREEKIVISNVLDIISTIERRLSNAKTTMQQSFSPQILSAFLQENTLEHLELAKNPAQVRYAAFLQREIENSSTTLTDVRFTATVSGPRSRGHRRRNMSTRPALLLNDKIIQPEVRNTLFSLLSEAQFLKDNLADIHMKILSVGVPRNFSSQLSDRIRRSAINEKTFKDKQFDVVSINVYKRDARLDDIVFKPQSFLFDLSFFQPILSTDGLIGYQAREQERFDNILLRGSIMDFESILNPRARSFQDIINDSKYDFINDAQKRELIKNHIISAIFQIYLQLLTGMQINESTFTEKDIVRGISLEASFRNLVLKYLRETLRKDLPNKSIPELLLDANVDDESKDVLRLITFGDSSFEPAVIRETILSPKQFDRIFHIPIDIDNFEVDEDLTNSTESGRSAFQQSFVQERLVRDNDKLVLRPKDRNELRFEDIFITIENDI